MEFLIFLIFLEVSFLVSRSVKKSPLNNSQKRKVYVDTSALMDPRLLAVAETGFIGDDLFIPRSVTNELQLLADGKDAEKRARARAGLETVRALERVVYFNASILSDELDHTPVDNRLLDLAKQNRGVILTNDYNLQKVAETEHIDILNLNELALVLRPKFATGDEIKVKILAAGSNPGQGIGYLEDGTMAVIDHADKRIGEKVTAKVIRLNQSASGTMVFAKFVGATAPIKSAKSTKSVARKTSNSRSRRKQQ